MSKQPMNPIVHRGPLDDAGVRRILEEVDRHPQFVSNQENADAAMQAAQGFVAFVAKCLDELGLISAEVIERTAQPIGVQVESPDDLPAFVKALWNTKSLDHAVVESPMNYMATMATLLEYLELNPRKRRETLLSLGSGPGLYEIYLGWIMQKMFGPSRVSIACIDIAPRMKTAFKKAAKKSRSVLNIEVKNVAYAVDDMTRLATVKDRSIDTILCNNALQWVPEWKKVLPQMARVMDPQGMGQLHLFIHPHPMSVCTADGQKLFSIGEIGHEELFDELEACRFQIWQTRQIAGADGTGQLGRATNRLFVLARFMPDGIKTHWRDASVSAAVSLIR